MGGRPSILFPLFAGLETLPGVGEKTAKALSGLGVSVPRDLLFVLPHAVIDRSLRDTVAGVAPGKVVTVAVTVIAHEKPASRGRPYKVVVEDASTRFHLVFFHARADYLLRQMPIQARRVVSGKLEHFDTVAQIVHPDHILPLDAAGEIPEFEPVYPLTAGVSQKLMQRAVEAALDRAPDPGEWMDPALVERQNWPDWRSALIAAHAPQTREQCSPDAPARRRLAYDEFFAHHLTLALARARSRARPGRASVATGALQSRVLDALPYRPTTAQTRAIKEISADMAHPYRMNRLLQGDVGAGKTLVAFMALLVAVEAGGQGVMMAPTEILARQHLAALLPLAEQAGVVIGILTGRDKGEDRARKLSALKRGDIHILVGTHAVFQDDVVFEDLRLAVVDEQHRFGVNQRQDLGEKGHRADVLLMTATPIPRSLTLAIHGHMDVSVLDEKPPGRSPVKTALISDARIDQVIGNLRQAIDEGRQAYWVCPLADESDISNLTSAEDRFRALEALFPAGQVGLVHGQLPPDEKDAAMAAFARGETRLLVATTVIEVGVDVPDASIMVIERAETFGLSQLHQLRGRVGRGAAESTCVLLYRPPLSETALRRLTTLRETEDGFRIAEVDLELRGGGDLIGTAQSGLPRFQVADAERQLDLQSIAQSDARNLLDQDPTLTGPRGETARILLWLMRQDRAIRLLSVG